MRFARWLLTGWLATFCPLRADWTITTVETGQCRGETVQTVYYKGELRRTDTVTDGVRQPTTVLEGNEQILIWDADRKEYTEASRPRYMQPASFQTSAPNAPAPVITIELHTVDTGKRETFFGRSARHLITTQKVSGDPTGLMQLPERAIDAWYVDGTGLPDAVQMRGLIFSALATGPQPVWHTKVTGPRPSGLAVRETVTSHDRNRLFAQEETTEVKQLDQSDLSPALFAPPAGYRQVKTLANQSFACKPTFSDEIETYWNSIENWFWWQFR